jgi:hypothetical protein
MASTSSNGRRASELGGSRESEALVEDTMPMMFNLSGRRPTRLRWLYRQVQRACAPPHELFHAGGATAQERAAPFPCDALLEAPLVSYYRGIEVQAPKEIVFRWLCQIRVAPYSYDWFDNFGRESPRQLTPGLQRLEVGQALLVMFRIVDFAENEHITVVGETFEWIAGQRIAMTYRVVPCGPSSCRIVTKLAAHNGPHTFLNHLRRELIPIGELPLMRKQLLTMKQLSEQQFQEELADGRRLPVNGQASGLAPARVSG